jgi:hypothetical protein
VTRERRILIWTAIIAALSVVTWLRILLIDSLQDQGWFIKYYELAGRALEGQIPVERLGDVSPLYFWLIVLMRAAGLGLNAIRDIQIAGLSIAALLCAIAAYRLAGVVAGIATGILILGNRAALVIATDLEPEILILVLTSGALLALTIWFTTPREKFRETPATLLAPIAAGLLSGLSATARPTALAAIGLLAVWAILRDRRSAIVFIAAAVLPIATVLVVNRSLTGSLSIMQPGSQLYDANNPLATGAAAVLPRIILDLERDSREPDYPHIAYRLVTARATGQPPSARATNRYWTGKAIDFMTTYPGRAIELFAWKALLAIHNYDIYDLYTTRMKGNELARWPAIPFGAVFALALVGLFVHRDRLPLVPILLVAAAVFFALVVFNVTARQRNALLGPLSILGGVGAAGIFRLARQKNDGAFIAFGAVVVLTPLLGIEGPPMKENALIWRSTRLAGELRDRAVGLRDAGEQQKAFEAAAMASILDPSRPLLVEPEALRRFSPRLLADTHEPAALFNLALTMQRVGAWRESEEVLSRITGYRPLRENRSVSSVSYYRARAALRLGAENGVVREFLDRAIREAPGDPDVLALRSVMGDPEAERILDALHDPFTRDFALAQAHLDAGNPGRAGSLLRMVMHRMPEWRRPAAVRHALRTAQAESGSSETRE